MPTYQYACTACGHQLEVVQSFSDDPLTQCPECEGLCAVRLGRVASGPGFYRTDSRAGANGGGKNGKSTRGGSAGGDGSGGDGAGAKAKGGDGGGATTSKSSDTASKTTTSSSS